MTPRTFYLRHEQTLRCALEVAADVYRKDALIAREAGFAQIAEQFDRQIEQACMALSHLEDVAPDANDGPRGADAWMRRELRPEGGAR